MPVTLPVDADNKLVPFTSTQVEAMAIKRIGVRDHSHVTWNFGPDGSYCSRRFACAWDEKFSAQQYFVGAVTRWLDGGNPKISRMVPQRDPDFPRWICTKAEIMPWRFTGEIDDPEAGSEPYPVFTRAELRCVYELSPFEVATDAEVTTGGVMDESLRYVTAPGFPGADVSTEASYIGLPGSVMQYTTVGGTGITPKPQGIPIPYPVGFVEPGRKLSVVWRRIPRECWGPGTQLFQRVIGTETAQGHLGAVNKTTFFGHWSTTLQLIGVEERLLPDPTGLDYSWDLRYVFQHKPVPHGHFGYFYHPPAAGAGSAGYYQALRGPSAAGGTIDDPADITDGKALFVVREMDELFVVGSV